MDNIDDANERAATYLQARIDAVTKVITASGVNATSAAKNSRSTAQNRAGVRLCIDCKELEELNQRTHR